jgi:hypothetical protein
MKEVHMKKVVDKEDKRGAYIGSIDNTWVFVDDKKTRKIHVRANLYKTNKQRKETFQPYIDQIIKEILEGKK